MAADELTITISDDTPIALTRWGGAGASVVLLHANVADRRGWAAVAGELASDGLDLVAPERRGFGDTPPAADPASFTHVDDLVAVLDGLGIEKALLVGNSMGGALALDTALAHPDRVSGVVLLSAAVSGMTDEDTPFDWVPDAASGPLMDELEAAEKAGDAERQVELLTRLWLDGPGEPEGRVGGDARALFVAMNRRIVEIGASWEAGASPETAWGRLGEITVPVLATWGSLDVEADHPFYAETARRIGQEPGRVLPGVAHVPGLEDPALVADLIRELLAR